MLLLFILFFINSLIYSEAYPIGFSIPEIKIVSSIPEKTRDFAKIIPGQFGTYIYKEESSYYKGYQEAYFGVTHLKGGWDCLRHYEILCNGCIPYFLGLDECPENTLTFLPKELIKEAMNLEGVYYLHIDHSKFDKQKYNEILAKLLEHTKKYLSTRAMATYVLEKINYKGSGKILFLSRDKAPDYLRCTLLIGLNELLPGRIVDFPKIPHIYTDYTENVSNLYGRGMSYTKIVKDTCSNRENIEKRIRNREFDLIIYGSIHRGMPYYSSVKEHYSPDEIVYFCGEDLHQCNYMNLNNFFIRELK
jgi:hypothetical protein